MHIGNREINLKKVWKDSQYVKYYKMLSVDPDKMLAESQSGMDLQEHMRDMLEMIANEGSVGHIYLVYKKGYRERIEKSSRKIAGKKVMLVEKDSKRYQQLLASAKWLLNDEAFPNRFVKKTKQNYIKIYSEASRWNLYGDAREILQIPKNRDMQKDCLKADYFICFGNSAAGLQKSPVLENLCNGKIIRISRAELPVLYRHIWKETKELSETEFACNGKQNVIIYLSAMEKNGITASCMSLLSMIDLKERNYIICHKDETEQEIFQRLEILPEQVGVLSMEMLDYTLKEYLCKFLYYKLNRKKKRCKQILQELYDREYCKNFGNIRFDTLIHYTGYESDMIQILGRTNRRKIIYVHSDMEQEIALKKYQHMETLREAYGKYDRVVCVTKDVLPSTKRIGGESSRYVIGNNCHNDWEVKEKAKKKISFDLDTVSTHSLEQVQKILEEDAVKFITVGRFSPEKGHLMLMDAFAEYQREHENTYLIIIGGYGPLYEKTLEYAEKLNLRDRIVIIKSMKNPMPVLKRCNLFIISSLYEGLGLVLLEAASLGVPVISTDVNGPRGFMKEYGGTLVPPDKEGLLSGMEQFAAGRIQSLKIDFDEYNRNSVEQFETLLI